MKRVGRHPDAVRRHPDDGGFTLIEGLVAMTIFVAILSVMTTVIATMTDNMRQAEGVSVATDQTRMGFQRLDRQVRYASGIAPLGPSGAWSVTFRLDRDDPSPLPRYTCYEWRVDSATGRLQTRSWNEPASPPGWQTVAVGIANSSGQPPFRPASSVRYEGFSVELLTEGSKKPRTGSHLKSTFFARNTDPSTPVTSVCP